MNIYTIGSCNMRYHIAPGLKKFFTNYEVKSFIDINSGSSQDFLIQLTNAQLTDGDVYFVEASPHDIYHKGLKGIWEKILLVIQSKAPNSKIVNINLIKPPNTANFELVNSMSIIKRDLSNGINFINIDAFIPDISYYRDDLVHFNDVRLVYKTLVEPQVALIVDKLKQKIYEKKEYVDTYMDIFDFKISPYRYNKYIIKTGNDPFIGKTYLENGIIKKEFTPAKNFWPNGWLTLDIDNTSTFKMEFDVKLNIIESYHYQYDPDKFLK